MSDKQSVLVIDDERDIRELLTITLERMNLDVSPAANAAEARAMLEQGRFDLCFTDMRLPDGSGQDIIELIAEKYPDTPVAMITAYGNVDAAVDALKAGAFDFVSKPVDIKILRRLVQTALSVAANTEQEPAGNRLIGTSTAMETLRTLINKLARNQAPVYVSGESGVGKELVARLIHEHGPRASGPFVPVNCGAIPSELMESEFFGHKKGSFTGAQADKEGLFQTANEGTLFLDEVAELPMHMQVKLLRVIQEKAVRPIGGRDEASVDVRILSATHKDLGELVELGEFRQDLYYRINVIELAVPPLRERREDIPELARKLLARLARDNGIEGMQLDDGAIGALCGYSFPGNVRELENILERAVALRDGDVVTAGDLMLPSHAGPQTAAAPPPATAPEQAVPAGAHAPAAAPPTPATPATEVQPDPETTTLDKPGDLPLDTFISNVERQTILKALEATHYNKTKAAKKLGITFRALRYKLKKLEID